MSMWQLIKLLKSSGFEVLETGGFNPYGVHEKIINFKFITMLLKKGFLYSTKNKILSHWCATQYLVLKKS